jgi:type II secretory pathway component GspD/PulD (secretin)
MGSALILSVFLAMQDPAPTPPQETQEKRLWPTKRIERGDLVTIFYRTGHMHPEAPLTAHEPHGAPPSRDPAVGNWFKPLIEKFLDTAKGEWVLEAEHLHTLTVTVHKDNEKMITDIIESLDSPKPQVDLEATIAEVVWSRDQELGFEGGLGNFVFFQAVNPDALLRTIGWNFRPDSLGAQADPDSFRGSAFRFGANPSARQGTYNWLIRAFVERGKGTIKSQPKLVVNSGSEAEFKSIDQVPIPTGRLTVSGATQDFQFKDVGTIVKLHPHVVAQNQIDLEIDVELSTIQRFEEFPVAGDIVLVPVITSRNSHSHLTVTDNQEIVISGLVQHNTFESTRGLPFLSDIPILGTFLRSSNEEGVVLELVIIIKPTVYTLAKPLPKLIDPLKDK